VDPSIFINRVFQWTALERFALMLEQDAQTTCTHRIEDPEAGGAFAAAEEAEEYPRYVCHAEHGHFVIHTFERSEEDPEGMRMVCWAEMGPKRLNEVACQWWKDQGADPDAVVPGITDLHREEPKMLTPEEAAAPPYRPTPEDAIKVIRRMADLNPDGDPHGAIDPPYTKLCRDYDPDRETETPLTLEEWKALRDAEDFDAALSRDILDATNPFVFLAVLRDRLVHASGCSGFVISVISVMVDPHIDSRTMTWRGEGD
jgi:hypothetical protein